MTVITNPLVNSYKRLVPGFDVPAYSGWSTTHQNSLIRVPGERGEDTRLKLRSPDPSANPYLTLAVCLRAGLMESRIKLNHQNVWTRISAE